MKRFAWLYALLLILALLLMLPPRSNAPGQLGPQWQATLVKVTAMSLLPEGTPACGGKIGGVEICVAEPLRPK